MNFLLPLFLYLALGQNQGPAITGAVGSPSGTTNHARAFNGSSDYLQSASALSSLSGVSGFSMSFWMNWTTNASNDALAFESSSNYNNNVGAIIVDPNDSSFGGFQYGASNSTNGSQHLSCEISRPTAGVWHHYVLELNTNTQACAAYVDGSLVTSTREKSTSSFTLSSQTLNVMSRNGSSLFGAGSMSEIAFYNGGISSGDAAALAGCGRATSVTSATLLYYWEINQVSPETPTTGSINLTVNGTTTAASHCSF